MPDPDRRLDFVAFRVSPAEKRELKLLAKAEGASTSEVIRRAVRERAEAISGGSESR